MALIRFLTIKICHEEPNSIYQGIFPKYNHSKMAANQLTNYHGTIYDVTFQGTRVTAEVILTQLFHRSGSE